MNLTTGYEDRRARIEIVPLIDVVFLLLVFFIYAMVSMTVYKGLRVQLPSGAGTSEKPETVIIAISEEGGLWVDGREMTMEDAVSETVQRITDTEMPVLVSGDRRAELGVAVELLSALREADVESVSFQVKQGQ